MKKGDTVKREFHFGTGDKTIEGVIVQADTFETMEALLKELEVE